MGSYARKLSDLINSVDINFPVEWLDSNNDYSPEVTSTNISLDQKNFHSDDHTPQRHSLFIKTSYVLISKKKLKPVISQNWSDYLIG